MRGLKGTAAHRTAKLTCQAPVSPAATPPHNSSPLPPRPPRRWAMIGSRRFGYHPRTYPSSSIGRPSSTSPARARTDPSQRTSCQTRSRTPVLRGLRGLRVGIQTRAERWGGENRYVHAKWVRKRDGYVYAEVGGEAKWVRKREGSAFIRFKGSKDRRILREHKPECLLLRTIRHKYSTHLRTLTTLSHSLLLAQHTIHTTTLYRKTLLNYTYRELPPLPWLCGLGPEDPVPRRQHPLHNSDILIVPPLALMRGQLPTQLVLAPYLPPLQLLLRLTIRRYRQPAPHGAHRTGT